MLDGVSLWIRNGQHLGREPQTEGLPGFIWTSRMLEMLFLISWIMAMVHTIVMMALSTCVKAQVLFLEWLDHPEVGVTPEGQASSSS